MHKAICIKHLAQGQAHSKKSVNISCYYFMKINKYTDKFIYKMFITVYFDNKNLKQLKCLTIGKYLNVMLYL